MPNEPPKVVSAPYESPTSGQKLAAVDKTKNVDSRMTMSDLQSTKKVTRETVIIKDQ